MKAGMEGSEKSKKEVGDHTPIDILAKKGLFKTADLPGIDTFDDGLDEKGRVKPGSTTLESGGIYMEDTGPLDLRRRASGVGEGQVRADKLQIAEEPESPEDIYSGNDKAAKWLRENDPKSRKDDRHEAA